MDRYSVYRISFRCGQDCEYVGITRRSVAARIGAHRRGRSAVSRHLGMAIEGRDFEVTVVADGLTRAYARAREAWEIRKLRYPLNQTLLGEGFDEGGAPAFGALRQGNIMLSATSDSSWWNWHKGSMPIEDTAIRQPGKHIRRKPDRGRRGYVSTYCGSEADSVRLFTSRDNYYDICEPCRRAHWVDTGGYPFHYSEDGAPVRYRLLYRGA